MTMDAAKITAALALIAFAWGSAYDYGYFNELGYNYFNLLTYKDHLGAVVYFVPPLLLLSLPGLLRHKFKYVDVIGGAILALSVMFWLVKPPPSSEGSPHVVLVLDNVIYSVKAVLTTFGLCYLISIIVDVPTFWTLESKDSAILFSASIGLLLFSMWGGILSYHNAVSERVFNTEVVFAKDSGIESPATAFILRFVDNGTFLIRQKDPTRLAYVRKEAVNLVSRIIVSPSVAP